MVVVCGPRNNETKKRRGAVRLAHGDDQHDPNEWSEDVPRVRVKSFAAIFFGSKDLCFRPVCFFQKKGPTSNLTTMRTIYLWWRLTTVLAATTTVMHPHRAAALGIQAMTRTPRRRAPPPPLLVRIAKNDERGGAGDPNTERSTKRRLASSSLLSGVLHRAERTLSSATTDADTSQTLCVRDALL